MNPSDRSAGTVHYEKRGALPLPPGEGRGEGPAFAVLTLDRPGKLNALFGTMREELLDGLERGGSDPEVGCVVITGAGGSFCAGGDLDAMWALKEREDVSGFARLVELGMRVVRTLRGLGKPSLAAIPGVAAGAGLSLAGACDLRLAADRARFAAGFVKIGLQPDWGLSYFLPRLVGADKAAELCLSGEPIGADEALRIGLVERVVSADALETVALDLARDLATRDPLALSLIRTSFGAALPSDLDAALQRERSTQLALFKSAGFRDRLAAFQKRRATD